MRPKHLLSPALALARALLLAAALGGATLPAPAMAREAPASFADLAQQLLPAVVNISSTQTVHGATRGGPEIPAFPPGSPFEQFFHDFMEKQRHPPGGQGNGPDGEAAPRRSQSLGSGFIVDAGGLVVTNNHVIADADEISVTLQDNTTLKAELVGKDDRTDLALLRVHTDRKLPAVAFGDSDRMRVGDWVLAIGNPFGLGGSVTAGIVSARGRDIRQGPYDDFLQTDAPINRGNSGGPLFNMAGEVIGVNTAIYSPSGGSIGIGFAIPSDMVRSVVAQLRQYGHPRRGWLGVRIQQVTPDIAESLGLHGTEGALVAGINPGGPADKAGLRNGDAIQKFNGQDVKDMRALSRLVAETPVGQAVPVQIARDGKPLSLSVTVAEMPDDTQAAAKPAARPAPAEGADLPGTGLRLGTLTDGLRARYQITDDQRGLVVLAASAEAARRGIKPGDVVVEVQQQAVTTPDEAVGRLAQLRKQGRRTVLLLVQGADGLRWVPLQLG